MGKYGATYMGSKSSIAEDLCKRFPKRNHFFDLFGGGAAITHCMSLRRKDFQSFHYNDYDPLAYGLIKNAIEGKYSYKNNLPKWISREEFSLKNTIDPYVKYCWSFGNRGTSYLFGKHIENEKRSLHNAVVFNEFDSFAKKALGIESFSENMSITERRLLVRNLIKRNGNPEQLEDLEQLERLQRLQQLERLQQLQQLQQLERLELTNLSYDEVEIKENSLVYCDIPYRATNSYTDGKNKRSFDHDKFYDWAASQTEPVFISEYDIKDKRFKYVWNIGKRQTFTGTGTGALKTEKIFVNQIGYELILKQMKTR